MKRITQILCIFCTILSIAYQQNEQKNERSNLHEFFSFDFNSNLVPKAYFTYGAGIRLKSKVKLMPSVPNKIGAVFLRNKFRTNSFTIDYIFKINSNTEISDGFVMWFLHDIPSFDIKSERIHGVSQDSQGLGVRLYKTQDNKWRIYAHYDRGDGVTLEKAIVTPDNSCTFILDPTKVNTKIRIEKINGKISLFVTDDSAQSENWRSCVVFHNELLNYQGFIGFTAGNVNNIVNDIDIFSVKLYDNDPNSIYILKNTPTNNAEVRYVDFRNETNANPTSSQDILHRQKNTIDESYSHKTVEFRLEDNKEQLLINMWETLRIYNLNMANLIKTMRRFDKDRSELVKQSTEDKKLTSIFQNLQDAKITIDLIGNSLVTVNDTVTFLSSEVKDVKSDLSREEQDTTQRLISMISNLNYKIDNLQAKMQSHESHSQTYISQLNDKANQLKKDMGNIMIDTLNKQSDQIGQKVSNDGSYWTYIFVIVLVVGLTLLMRRKIQNETKKHIL